MKQESMPVEQDGMALAAQAPVLDAEDTPKVDESAPVEETLEVEQASEEEPPAAQDVAAPTPDQEKANFFSKIWGILTAKPEITVPIVLIFSLVLGLIIGYSVVGGGPVKDVFKPETWTHIVKLVFG